MLEGYDAGKSSPDQKFATLKRFTTAATTFYPSRHPGLDPWFDRLTTLSEVEGGSSKNSLLSAKSHFWIPDSSRMTTEMQLLAISDKPSAAVDSVNSR